MKIAIEALLLAVIALPLSCQGKKMELNPSRGTFEKMLVFINDNVQEHDGRLLESLKDSLKAASKALWTATKNLDPIAAPNAQAVQFGNIFIRVPSTWNVYGQQLTWQQCTKANFFLSTNADNGNRWQPVTKQLGKCGQPAESMRLPESFFLNLGKHTSLREKGKIFLTEFAKLRYGVFNEKPHRRVLTYFTGFKFANSTCGADIRWTLTQPGAACSEPNKVCKYSIDRGQNHNFSVMFDSETPSSEYFCNDHNRRHNQMAKTLHNLKCKRRSVANVILSHSDFKNPTRPRRPYQEPTFTIVKGQNRRLVLVLDVSTSMSTKIDTMKKALAEFVANIKESANVGLVSFSGTANILSPLTPMKSSSNRELVLKQIKGLVISGSTNIPDGLAKGVQVLGGSIKDSNYVMGTIIILSDGGNNKQKKDYKPFIESIITKGIVANTISYGTVADPKLNRLAEGSNGKFLFSNENDYSQLLSVFEYRSACELTLNQTIQVMQDERIVLLGSEVVETDLAYIDKFVGINVKIVITFPELASQYIIQLLDPAGTVFNSRQKISHTNGFTLSFQLPDRHRPGKYKLRIQRQKITRMKRKAQQMKLKFAVTAKISDRAQSDEPQRKILPTGELITTDIPLLNSLTEVPAYVDLTSCGLVAGENVTVTLAITHPTGNSRSLFHMTDDGLGSDSISGDQIYSTSVYAKDLKVAGFFTLSASVLIGMLNGETIYRTVNLGSLRVQAVQQQPIEDKIPPSPINFVEVKVHDVRNRILTLNFLASGDDGMQGNISKYKVKVNWYENQTKEVIIVHVFKVIVSPGNMIQMKVDLSKFNVTNPFWIRVLGEDDKGNMGEWSQPTTFNWHYEDIKKKSIDEEQRQGGGGSGRQLSPLLLFPALLCVSFLSSSE